MYKNVNDCTLPVIPTCSPSHFRLPVTIYEPNTDQPGTLPSCFWQKNLIFLFFAYDYGLAAIGLGRVNCNNKLLRLVQKIFHN